MPSEPDITIDIAAPAWERDVPGAAALARRAALATLAAEGFRSGRVELGISLADDAAVGLLNRDWRGQDKPTNVLSFPGVDPAELGGLERGDRPLPLGDVVLACETVLAEAEAQGKPAADHLAHLVVHGVLHLLGHDHIYAQEAERMEAREVAILAGLDISDPYQETERACGPAPTP